MIFTELQGDDLGCYRDDNYRLMQCYNGHIVFSYARRGDAINIHFSCDRKGVRYIKQALNDFCNWLFNRYEWCKMVLGMVEETKKGVCRLGNECGFFPVGKSDDVIVYARAR